jgi:hypothetical protein
MKLMELPPETRSSRHRATTIGRVEETRSVRGYGRRSGRTERRRVGDQRTIVVWSPDYDGKGKAGALRDDGGG